MEYWLAVFCVLHIVWNPGWSRVQRKFKKHPIIYTAVLMAEKKKKQCHTYRAAPKALLRSSNIRPHVQI